ncbi:MAG: hypothetical protein R3B48_10390 [Kofleriaceae bacterium]
MLMALSVACKPVGAAPPIPDGMIPISPGTFQQLERQEFVTLKLTEPSSVFLMQNGIQIYGLQVPVGSELPRELQLSLRELTDDFDHPVYVVALNPGVEISWLSDQCMKCQPVGRTCCVPPPLKMCPQILQP